LILDSGLTSTHVGAYIDLGTTECSGGAYTRVAVTWTAASGSIRDNNAQLSIPIAAGQTVVVGSIHSAISAGTLHGWFQIGSTLRGVATVDSATDLFLSKAHGLTTDSRVFFTTVAGEAIPTGVSVSTLYYVLAAGLTADAFSVSTTSGGGALNVTVSGEAAWFCTVPNTFASAGNLIIASGALDVDSAFVA
jgi:hypothetical protein